VKQTPEYDKIQQNMRKGVITLDGFLGDDTRKLVDIIAEDTFAIHAHHTTKEAIASRMEYFRKQGEEGLGEPITVDGNFEVRVDSVRGLLPSPFGGPGMYAKVNTSVLNKSSGKSIVYTDLHIHFIKDHGFFEGKGSPFRLEPKELIEILEVPQTEEL
jgi:hypothetical protein